MTESSQLPDQPQRRWRVFYVTSTGTHIRSFQNKESAEIFARLNGGTIIDRWAY